MFVEHKEREAQTVERPTVREAKKRGWIVIKITAFGGNKSAWPDRLFLKNGVTVFIEFKRPGKEPTDLQWKRIHELQGQGFAAWWFDDETAALAFLDRHDTGTPIHRGCEDL